jgi:hypothetical protein
VSCESIFFDFSATMIRLGTRPVASNRRRSRKGRAAGVFPRAAQGGSATPDQLHPALEPANPLGLRLRFRRHDLQQRHGFTVFYRKDRRLPSEKALR